MKGGAFMEKYLKFDMHCHTKEGSVDGKVMIEDYIKILKEKGFGGMLVTDHDSYDGYREWKRRIKGKRHKDFVVLKGVEYDTGDCGHMIIVMPEGVKLRILEMRGLPVLALIQIVHYFGGIIGPAHPYGEKYVSMIRTRRKKGMIDLIMKQVDFVEVFNACENANVNHAAVRLASKYKKPGLGGSDAHRKDCVGRGYACLPSWIQSESDLIQYVKSRPHIACGGSFYHRTTKEKIGRLNKVLVNSFFVYNKVGGWAKSHKRTKELKKY